MLLAVLLGNGATATDWPRFRGPNGGGVNLDGPTPTQWSETENLKWKLELPGPGSSSPIVVGDRVFLTCWTGYGTDPADPGDQKDLARHLLCINRETGKIEWSQAVAPSAPEEPFRGMFAENGYASHTPVSDGERVYVFFGKSGVIAFDMKGNQLWQKGVGIDSDPRGWGSASSPILYKNLVIVTASAESQALVAFDGKTGEEAWRSESEGYSGTWGTPILVEAEGRTDLVLAVPYEIWGLNPDTGKLRWYCNGIEADSMCSSVVAGDGIVYAVEAGPGGGGAIAVRAGGTGDVTKTHVLWTQNERSRIGTPLIHEGRMYWITGGVANCIDAVTGERVYQERLGGPAAPDGNAGQAGGRPGGRRRGGGGFGGFGGGQDYSSPVAADGKLYFVSRTGDMSVLALGSEFSLLAQNRFDEPGDFSATPAISNGELLIRSNKFLYCVAEAD